MAGAMNKLIDALLYLLENLMGAGDAFIVLLLFPIAYNKKLQWRFSTLFRRAGTAILLYRFNRLIQVNPEWKQCLPSEKRLTKL